MAFSVPQARDGPLRVATFPPAFGDNPYQRLFETALARRGITQAAGSAVLSPRWARTAHKQVDAVHLHWIEFLYLRMAPRGLRKARAVGAGASVELALRMLGRSSVPVVWTLHNLRPHEGRLPMTFDRLRQAACAAADLVICHSDAAAQRARVELGREGGVVGVRHGHYVDAYPASLRSREEARTALGIGPQEYVYLSFGHIRPYKCVPELIRAFRRIPEQDVRLLVAGGTRDAALRAQVESLAAADRRVVLRLGVVPDDEVRELHELADALVLNHRDLFSSGALMLGLSMGLPIVAPESGTLRESAPGAASVPFPTGRLEAALGEVRTRDPAHRRAAAFAAARASPWDLLAEAAEAGYRSNQRFGGLKTVVS